MVSDGQDATAAVFNSAFPSRTVDSSISSKLDFLDTDPLSGAVILNTQKEINEAKSENYGTEVIGTDGQVSIDLVRGTQNRLVISDGGDKNINLIPFGDTGGWKDGTEIRLVGGDASNTLNLIHNDNDYGVILNGNMGLGLYDGITLVWFNSLLRWVEITRNN